MRQGLLARALIWGYVPRIVTSVATLVSFPLVVSALGPVTYGTAATVGAFVGLLQLIGDFGISSAVSRAVAHASARERHRLRFVISRWAGIQLSVCAVFLVIALAAVSFAKDRLNFHIDSMAILAIPVLTATFAIMSAFVRAALRALACFERLAIVDTMESLCRSGGWLVVAFAFRTVEALFIAEATAVLLGFVATSIMLVAVLCSAATTSGSETPIDVAAAAEAAWPLARIFRESLAFLGIRLATQSYTQVSVLVAGRVVGVEAAAVMAVLVKLVDMVNGPVTLLGLAVGVKAVQAAHGEPVQRLALWNQMARVCSLWTIVSAGFLLCGSAIAALMLPTVGGAGEAIAIFAIFVQMNAISSIVTVVVDYLGKAGPRALWMVPNAFVQVGAIVIGGRLGGLMGIVVATVASYVALVAGYVVLSALAVFGRRFHPVPGDAAYIPLVSLAMMFVYFIAERGLGLPSGTPLLQIAFVSGLLGAGLVTVFALSPGLRRYYLPRALLA